MRKLIFAALLAALAAPCALSQTTTITASHIAQDLSGSLLPQGQLCLTPVGVTGAPTGFQASGIQYLAQQTCVPVTNGAISGFTVPDVLDINPAGVGYQVSIADVVGNTLRNYEQPIYPTGATWSLDAWSPTQTVTIATPTTVSHSVNPPQGRCGINPAIDYTATTVYTCINQVWVAVVSSSGGTLSSASIATALGYTPVSPSSLTSAVNALPALNSANIAAALGYAPASPTDLSTAINGIPALNSANVISALGYTPVSPSQLAAAVPSAAAATPTFLPTGGGYTSTQSVALADATNAATISYCVNLTGNCTPNIPYSAPLNVTATETICASALAGSGGIVSQISCNTYTINSGAPPPPVGTGIGTILAQGSMTNGSIPFKTCFTGSSQCSGGVSGTPAVTPTHSFGGNSPSANTGTSNAVGNFNLQIGTTGSFTSALWTPSGSPSGLGLVPSATNFYHSFWIKVGYPAGPSRIEFDSEAFDSSWDWMFGTQCNSDNKLIQADNQVPSWTNTVMPCSKLYDGNYHHVEFTYHRTLAADRSCGPSGSPNTTPCECWDAGAIDGIWTAINVCKPATTSTWAGSHAQFQIDGEPTTASSGSPAVYNLWVDSDVFIAGLADTSSGGPGGGGNSTAGTGDLDTFNFDGGLTTPTGLTAVGSPVIVATKFHSTPNSAHFPSGQNYFTDTISPVNQIYTRQYVYIAAENSGLSDGFLRFYHGGAELFVYYFSTSGFVSYFDQATSASVTASLAALPTAGWHLVETYTKISATTGHVTVKIDGTQVYDSGSGAMNTGTSTIDTVWFGNIGNTAPTGWDTYQDNVDFDDTAWIGPI